MQETPSSSVPVQIFEFASIPIAIGVFVLFLIWSEPVIGIALALVALLLGVGIRQGRLAYQKQKISKKIKKIQSLSWGELEVALTKAFESDGYTLKVTGTNKDSMNLLLWKNGEETIVDFTHVHKLLIEREDIELLFEKMGTAKALFGIFITTGTYSEQALLYSVHQPIAPPVVLLDGKGFIEFLEEHSFSF